MTQEAPRNENREEVAWVIQNLTRLRFDCIDDLPEETITMDDPNYKKYKCRTNWWHSIRGSLQLLEDYSGNEHTEIKKQTDDFLGFIDTIDFSYGKRRTREEIDGANERLGKLIALLRAAEASTG